MMDDQGGRELDTPDSGCRAVIAVLVVLAVSAVLASAVRAQEALSYADLVKRMIDLEHLAVLPAPVERRPDFRRWMQ